MHNLDVVNMSFEEKYLGFPKPSGRFSKGKLHNLQQQLTKRIIQWGELMSQAGREVLIKAVAQALPTFLMSLFKFPRSTCDDLGRMIRSYWWGAYRGKRKTHWKSWDSMLRPISAGGMGFKDFRLFNQAMLARQAWRILVNPECFCTRVLKARYFPNGRLEDTVFTSNVSQTWQAIVHGFELLKKGLVWRIGNGQSVRIWRDSSIPHPVGRPPITQQGRCCLRRVSKLLDEHGAWHETLLQQYFLPVDVQEILKIKASPRLGADFLAWGAERTGIFTVRSVYWLALEDKLCPSSVAASRAPDGRRAVWALLWRCPAPPKVRVFAWRLATNSLATWSNKFSQHMEVTDICPLCGLEREDTFHVFCRCPRAVHLWRTMAEVWSIPDIESVYNTAQSGS